MPIPTDTFWNIKRLNRIFLLSVVAMMATFIWAVWQDYDKTWRVPQRDGRVWEAALIDERIHRSLTPEVKAHVEALDKQIAAGEAALESQKEYTDLQVAIKGYEGNISNLSVEYNNLKAQVTVDESNLETARTAGDAATVQNLTAKIAAPRATVNKEANTIADWKLALSEDRLKRLQMRAGVDKLIKERSGLMDTVEALEKREGALEPQGIIAKFSAMVRAMPLMQFLNPSERVQQVILPDIRMDVSFTRIDTIDRCATCHVHIADKRFTQEKVLSYLEEEAAAVHQFKYASFDQAKPGEPISTRPGATADPAFWHLWGQRLLSPASLHKLSFQVKSIAGAADLLPEPSALLQRHAHFAYDEKAATRPAESGAVSDADQVLLEIMTRLYSFDPALTKTPELATARTEALAYPGHVRDLLKAELPPDQYRELEDRYRFELVRVVNVERKKRGYEPLDPSPAQLAHSNLELYVDQDSPHGMEVIGCTSCHDGSGNETDFVLASHTPRKIWVDDQTGEPVLPAQLKNPPMHKEEATLGSTFEAVWPRGEAVPAHLASLHLDLDTKPAAEVVEAHPPDNAPATSYVDPVTGQVRRALPQQEYWSRTYETEAHISFDMAREMWDYPMRPPEYMQANCARCHNNFQDIQSSAPVLYEGRQLFAKMGCVDCHQMDSIPADDPSDPHSGDKRQVGTDLRHVSSKLSPAFVNTWMWAPKAFRPSTMMPHFFMAENSSSDEELRRTRQEARAITQYLFQTASPWTITHAIPPDIKGNAAHGAALFETLGCMGCHTNLNHVSPGKKTTTGEQWITLDLQKRLGMKAAPAKAAFEAMTYDERQMYALENLGEISSTPAQPKYPDGTPKPIFMHHGPELSGIGDKLTVGRTEEAARTWLFDWLNEPRHYSGYTIMPRLRLDNQQALDLAEYLLGQHRANVPTKDAKGQTVPDGWQATLFATDPEKLTEMTSFFLASLYGDEIAKARAASQTEMSDRARDALAAAFEAQIDADPANQALLSAQRSAKAREEADLQVKDMKLEQKQLVFLGSKLIAHYGCMNCHAINGMESVASPCANLSDWGQKGVDKLDFGYLDEHKVHALPPTYTLPMVNGLSVAAVTQIDSTIDQKEFEHHLSAPVTVAWPHVERSREAWLEQKLLNTRIWDRGRNLLDPVRELTGDRPDAPCALDKDGYPILVSRGRPYDKLKMPNFYLDDDQVHALVTFVISNRARLISQKLLDQTNNEEAVRIAKGRQITERFNCVSCHQIEGNFPAVRQYYKPDDWNGLAPPSLRGEGNKIQFAWLYGFLHNVIPIRPLPQIRMPSFPISDEETRSVAAYFAAASNREAAALTKHFTPINNDIALATQAELETKVQMPRDVQELAGDAAKARGTYTALLRHAGAQLAVHDFTAAADTLGQAQAVAAAAKLTDDQGAALADGLNDAIAGVKAQKVPHIVSFPDDDWYAQDKYAPEAAYLREWAVGNSVMPAIQFDPTKYSPQELGRNYRVALFKANFTAELYQAPYPFVDATRPELTEPDFKRGEKFFYQMHCLDCHVVGDPKAPGATEKPQAPNLSLAHQRLQPRWIEHWVQEPGVIQINTKMPPFMTGLGSDSDGNFDLHGQTWPLAQGGTLEEQRAVNETYQTKTVQDQKDLLVNFLFQAGRSGYTAVQPKAPAATAPATSP